MVYSDTFSFALQFSVTEHFKSSGTVFFQSVTGVFFFYDLSPIKVRVSMYQGTYASAELILNL